MAPCPAEIPRPLRLLRLREPGAGRRFPKVNSSSWRADSSAVRRFQSKIFMERVEPFLVAAARLSGVNEEKPAAAETMAATSANRIMLSCF